MGLATAPANLDPRYATDATSTRINRLLYRQLVDFDNSSRPVPALAEWQRVTPIHYRFTLQIIDRAFHNGDRLTSADVKATYDYILDQDNASPHRSVLSMIERIEVDGEDQIDFYLNRADALFPAYLAIGILPANLIAKVHPFQSQPVGSGPFRFLDWPEEGRLVLQRVKDGQQFEFLKVHEATVRILKLLRGEIDMAQNDLSPELLVYLAEKEGIKVEQTGGSNFFYIGFNLQDQDTGQLAVRQAIAYAIDRAAIIKHVMQGGAQPAQAMFPSSHWAGEQDLTPYSRDLNKARALLSGSGYDEANPLKLVYKTSSDPFRVRLATVIQSQLADAGIEVDLRSYDWGTVYGDIKAGRFQLYSLAWVGIKTPDIFRYVFHSDSIPPVGANRGRFKNAEVDQLIEQAEASVDAIEQARLYRQLQALLLQELPYVPLWYENQVFVSRDDIQGYHLASDGNYDGLLEVSKIW
ncbi:Dipeptide-binding ABC transporter, periplasmic substrate-binding component (TC 3.A.1.5.2) [hydrothermal vent metagenome]|uniref:Dipeptide-binding ABC transporter, periplasmic substrate-binding component (TC 3.A.1.5.2) n=1 Tax=hydrothermal vent metagenome TaxID=652676 RepID=A0A3B1AUW8_9ZZZZ